MESDCNFYSILFPICDTQHTFAPSQLIWALFPRIRTLSPAAPAALVTPDIRSYPVAWPQYVLAPIQAQPSVYHQRSIYVFLNFPGLIKGSTLLFILLL